MDALLIRLGILIAIFASVFILSQLLIGSSWARRSEKAAINRRLRMLKTGANREAVASALLKNAPHQLAANAGPVAKAYGRFLRMLQMSAVGVDGRRIIAGMAIGFCAVFGVMLLLAWVARFQITFGVVQLLAVLAVAISVGIPLMIISRIAQNRRKRMEEQFPVALDVFTRSLRAGHPIAAAIELITQEMQDPIGTEFGLISDEVAYGADLNDALLSFAGRWDLEDIRMFVVSVAVQNETGGNLSEILENLSKVIRARANMYMKVRALSSEGRMTGWMLTVLPVLTLVSMFAVNPAFYLDIARDPIFVIGFPSLIGLYIVGVLTIRKIIDLKV
ncbi:MAG: type II secretion system F family protein [Novosphingobium sp.]